MNQLTREHDWIGRSTDAPNVNRTGLKIICMILAFVAGLVLASFVSAQETDKRLDSNIEATATASTTSVQLAEPFTVQITAVATTGSKVIFFAVGEKIGPFDVIDVQDRFDVPAQTVDKRVWERTLTMETIATGELEVPSFDLSITTDGRQEAVSTEAIPIRVISVLEGQSDPTKFNDIRSVMDVDATKHSKRGWAFWKVAGGIGALVLVAMAIGFVTRQKKWLSPQQWAISELDRLSNSIADGLTGGEEVSTRLTSILRDYLEFQFEISAPTQTFQELLLLVAEKDYLPQETIAQFDEFFSMANQAKFAGLQLTESEIRAAIEDARRLVGVEPSLATTANQQEDYQTM